MLNTLHWISDLTTGLISMPNNDDHNKIARARGLKRGVYKPTNSFMDSSASLNGPQHRDDPIHSGEFCDFLEEIGMREHAEACRIHLNLDKKCDSFKEEDKTT